MASRTPLLRTVCATAFIALAVSIVPAGPAHAAEAGSAKVLKAEDLRATPEATGQTVTQLKAGADVKLLERKGFWQKVEAPGGTGWIKLSSLKLATGESATAGLAAIATGRGASGNVVSTSGTRGLSAEELTAATPDEKTYDAVQAAGVSAEDARRFADAGHLSPRAMDYVTPPKKQSSRSNKKN